MDNASEQIRQSDYCCRVDGSEYHIEADKIVGFKGTALWPMKDREQALSLFRHLVAKENSTAFRINVWKEQVALLNEQKEALEAAIKSGGEQADQHHQEQHRQTQAELAVWRDAASALAELADRAFFYSREERADADLIIKTIRKLKQ